MPIACVLKDQLAAKEFGEFLMGLLMVSLILDSSLNFEIP